jgi:hypothetical protein
LNVPVVVVASDDFPSSQTGGVEDVEFDDDDPSKLLSVGLVLVLVVVEDHLGTPRWFSIGVTEQRIFSDGRGTGTRLPSIIHTGTIVNTP